MVTIDHDKWYSTGQAAKLLGCVRATLVARIKAGHIKAKQFRPLGKGTPHRKVLGSEILRVLKEAGFHQPEAPPPAPKKKVNAARRDGERALKELGLA